jgi:hypothetical protein
MRRAFLVVCIILAAVALLWLAGSKAMSEPESDALAEPWPAGLGAAANVPRHYPPTVENEAARALRTFPFPAELRKELGAYVKQEIARGSADVAPPPSTTGAFLAAHVRELEALEETLTTQPIVWKSDLAKGHSAPLPDLRQVIDVQRLLLARALSRHDDPAAWHELHATWSVSRALLRRPELISALVGLAIARSTNAVARTLPPPAPAWREEMLSTDYSRAMVAALQAESWSRAMDMRNETFVDEDAKHDPAAPVERVFDVFVAPQRRRWAAEVLGARRKTAEAFHAMPQCAIPLNAT